MRTSTFSPPRFTGERRHEVQDDVIVVARIERHALLGTGGNHAADDIERAVAIERAILMPATLPIAAKRCQNADERTMPPTAGWR